MQWSAYLSTLFSSIVIIVYFTALILTFIIILGYNHDAIVNAVSKKENLVGILVIADGQ